MKKENVPVKTIAGDKRPGMISEKLLQFIWQFQYFNSSSLCNTLGESIQVLVPGTLNKNQGPDFLNAQVRIGNMLLAGSIELHCKTSQWNEHGHSADKNYNNVILHVVFENDLEEYSPHLPVLELESRISHWLLEKYTELMNAGTAIPCGSKVNEVESLTWIKWKERLLAERLARKSKTISLFLEESKFHWEEVFWWLLARNFGGKVNMEAFEAIAKSLPLNLLAKHRNQIHHLEALLLGQANLLQHAFSEEYPKLLAREYNFLRKKYGLRPIAIPVHFLRMRPGNFPTIRLAQLAMLIYEKQFLFTSILDCQDVNQLHELFTVIPNDYWLYHYMLDEPSPYKKKKTGKEAVNHVIANTVVPYLFSYGSFHKNSLLQQKAIQLLEASVAEENNITRIFTGLGMQNNCAADSQAFIELKTLYCDQQRCLECAIGYSVLRKNHTT
jgi:hypothetical protein